MGRQTTQIAVTEKTAAAMLDMKPIEFRGLVQRGALPRPTTIAGTIERWRVADLEAIVNGTAARPKDQDFEL
ncbi:hypothetical protein [Celeribacter ethanolicus]|uniref:hypothetical protein n=1 Tax=Celeribacter ethanolicus TaxID=1758178 RepID=UPI00082DD2F9|nr:hypothetical protein [Celeribacter ethanolicus]TNE64441.1 MAG: hypothetical protein EP336_15240 [Paracoccaceae bacterium]